MGISIGLVGLGAFGSAFAPLFKAHPRVDRIALCDREPERVARFADDPRYQDKLRSADVFASMDEICGAGLDALVIITQPWLHAPQAVQAMEAGCHVYSAVPVISLPDGEEILAWCDRLVETCRRTGRHYMLGETTCYRPEAMYCRRRAAEGAFGDFVHAEGEYLHDVDSASANLRQVRQRRLDSRAGREWLEASAAYRQRGVCNGPMHYPTHSTSGPMWVMRAHATRVSAWGFRASRPDEYFGDEFGDETALFRMSNGATLRICEYRQIGHPNSETFRIYGTEGSYRESSWRDRGSVTELVLADMRDPLPAEVEEAFRAMRGGHDVYGGHGGSHAYLVHEFVESVATERTPAINVWEAARYMAAGVAAHRSALRDGELLGVPDWGDAPA